MVKEFVSYEQAVVLKELGFDEECLKWYTAMGRFIEAGKSNQPDYLPFACSAPLKQQVFGWFREKYEYIPHIYIYENLNLYDFDIYGGLADKYDEYELGNQLYNTYEEAENACIDKLIELAKSI